MLPDPLTICGVDVVREVQERRLSSPADRKRLRELTGLTRIEVAELLDVSRQAVYAWELQPDHRDAREPTGDYRKRYAAFLAEARRAMAAGELTDV